MTREEMRGKLGAAFREMTTMERLRSAPFTWEELADAAITIIRAETLEEAAKELDRWHDIYGDNAAAAIRALKEGK